MTDIRSRMKILAVFMTVASVAACAAGIYITVNGAVELIHLLSSGQAERLALAPVITELAEGLVLGVHYFFVSKFFIHSLRHGVPFTHEGAKEIHILGLESILLPLAAWIVSAIAYAGIRSPFMVMEISVYEIVLGFALILVSYAIEYGTTKIELGHIGHEEIRYLEKHYPAAIEEARRAVAKMELAGARDHTADRIKYGQGLAADPLADVTDASDNKHPESGEYIQNIV